MRLFTGSQGRRPQTEARRYVYAILAKMLSDELRQGDEHGGGWMFGGVEDEVDLRRLKKAIKAVRSEMQRKAQR